MAEVQNSRNAYLLPAKSSAGPIQMAFQVSGKELALRSRFGPEYRRLAMRVGRLTVVVVGDEEVQRPFP